MPPLATLEGDMVDDPPVSSVAGTGVFDFTYGVRIFSPFPPLFVKPSSPRCELGRLALPPGVRLLRSLPSVVVIFSSREKEASTEFCAELVPVSAFCGDTFLESFCFRL